MPRLAAVALAVLLAACGETPGTSTSEPAGRPIPMSHARTFTVVERDGYRIVELRSHLVAWGGGSTAPEQRVRLVLVPREARLPELSGELAAAQVVRTPVQRIAVNYGSMEAILTALGVADRLVAVGGMKSYDDGIRARVRAGAIAQIGYGWHSPPDLAALTASRPDVLLMSLADLSHVQQMERIRDLGIPVMPVFIDNEPHYLGGVDYVRLVGMLVGREPEAEAFVTKVQRNVDTIRAKLAGVVPRSVMYAWYAGGDRWMATVRGGDALLLTDAGGVNVLREPDDPQRDNFQRISTETLLQRGRSADCWVWRDTHSQSHPDRALLAGIRAIRDGCLYAADGRAKPTDDAYDYYETGAIRPDIELGDLARMLHPGRFSQPFEFIRPDERRTLP